MNRILPVFALVSSALVWAEPGTFDRAREFPNYFLPAQYRGLPDAKVPEAVVQDSKQRVEAALTSLFLRLEVPVVPEGETRLQSVKYFEHLSEALRKIDPSAEVMPSAGVVRSALGYLYFEIQNGVKGHPPVSPEQTLERIARETGPIPGYRIRGVGSDFDVLLLTQHPELLPKLVEKAKQMTESAEAHFGARDIKGSVKKSLFTIPDVKSYQEQVTDASNQGGADIDWLAFHLDLAGKRGRFKSPERSPRVVENFLLGHYAYLPPVEGTALRSPEKQTIRGFRSLVELPFLALDSESRLTSEVRELTEKVKKGHTLDPRSVEQFVKMVRNARSSGGNNRLFRGAAGSVEEELSKLLGALHETTQKHAIPEFGDRFDLGARRGDHTEVKDLPKELLVPLDTFLREHTHAEPQSDGSVKHFLFHGTPSLDYALAILRGGLFLSGGRQKQGTYAYGRGVYTSPLRDTSLGYAGKQGTVLHLEVNADQRLNVLDLEKNQGHPWVVEARKRADARGVDFHEFLAREHGIDVILNGHVLLQNLEAVRTPEDLKMVLIAARGVVDNPNASSVARLNAWMDYSKLAPYMLAGGAKGLPELPPFDEFLRERLLSGDVLETIAAISEDSHLSSVAAEFLREDPVAKKAVRDATQELKRKIQTAKPAGLKKPLGRYAASVAHQIRLGLVATPSETHEAFAPLWEALEKQPDDEKLSDFLENLSHNGRGDTFSKWPTLVVDEKGHLVRQGSLPGFYDTLIAKIQQPEPAVFTPAEKRAMERLARLNYSLVVAMAKGNAGSQALLGELLTKKGHVADSVIGSLAHAVVYGVSGTDKETPEQVERWKNYSASAQAAAKVFLANPDRVRDIVEAHALGKGNSYQGVSKFIQGLPLDLSREENVQWVKDVLARASDRSRAEDLEYWMQKLLPAQPDVLTKHPELGLHLRMYSYSLEESPGAPAKFKVEQGAVHPLSDRLQALFSKLLQKKMPLSHEEKQLLKAFIQGSTRRGTHSDTMLAAAAAHSPETAAWVADSLVGAGERGTRFIANYFASTPGLDRQAHAILRNALDARLAQDPSARLAVWRTAALQLEPSELGSLPWDLEQEVDRRFLAEAFHHPLAKLKRRDDLDRRIERQHHRRTHFNSYRNLEGILQEIDAPDSWRDVYIASRLSESGELARRLGELSPAFAASAGAKPSVALEAEFDFPEIVFGEKRFHWENTIELWNTSGWDALPLEVRQTLDTLAANPLTDKLWALSWLNEGRAHEWLMRRLANLQAADDPSFILDLLRGVPAADLARIKPGLRKHLNRYFDERLPLLLTDRANYVRKGLWERYPFEWSDPADVSLLRKLFARFPRREDAVRDDFETLLTELPKNEVGSSVHRSDFYENPQSLFRTVRMVQRYRKLQYEGAGRASLDALALEIFEKDPVRFAREMGNVAFQPRGRDPKAMLDFVRLHPEDPASDVLLGYLVDMPGNLRRVADFPAARRRLLEIAAERRISDAHLFLESLRSENKTVAEEARQVLRKNPEYVDVLLGEMKTWASGVLDRVPLHHFPWDMKKPSHVAQVRKLLEEAKSEKGLANARELIHAIDRHFPAARRREMSDLDFTRFNTPECDFSRLVRPKKS